MFGIDTLMPYGNESENMLDAGVNIIDPTAKQQHYYEWQQLLMNKIVPMLPLFSPRSYTATWATLTGYDESWGYVDCLPYMEWSAYHESQESLTEFIAHDRSWRDLNPLIAYDVSSSTLSSLVMEPIIQMSPGGGIMKTGLVDDWEQINDSHFSFHMREGVFWNPSYDVRTRDGSTDLSLEIPVAGLKGLASDGTNQEVKAKDAVFSYLAWANEITSESPSLYDWIADIWVDEADDYTFHIVIDRDPDTAELEIYSPFWVRMPILCLPEFFLNSTDQTITTTGGGVYMTGIYSGILLEPEWGLYSQSAFGCGKYMLDYYVQNSVTVLQKSPYWFGVGAIDGTSQDLDIDTFIMKIIPEETSALAKFKAGKLDILDLEPFSDERKQMQQDSRFEVHDKVKKYFTFMFYNLRRPFIGGSQNYKFVDYPGKETYTRGAAVRKAINYAIDREEINEKVHDGEYAISNSPFYLSQDYWYYQNIIRYNFDLDASYEWMDAAGCITHVITDPITSSTTSTIVVTSTKVIFSTFVVSVSIFVILGALGTVVFVAMYKKRKQR